MKFFILTSWQVKVNCRRESRVYLELQTCQSDKVPCFHLDFTTWELAHSREEFFLVKIVPWGRSAACINCDELGDAVMVHTSCEVSLA